MGQCSFLERKSLTNVFSLDFLPNGKLGNLERGDPNTPPWKPSPKDREKGPEKPPEDIQPNINRC